jgi:hypothetical protein
MIKDPNIEVLENRNNFIVKQRKIHQLTSQIYLPISGGD